MIAVDSNVLVYAHREDSAWHDSAYACLCELAEGWPPWAIPSPYIDEFLAIVTDPRIYAPPTPLENALDQVEAWPESPSLVLLSDSGDYWSELRGLLETGKVSGPRVHDARIASLCQHHGVTELWTATETSADFQDSTHETG